MGLDRSKGYQLSLGHPVIRYIQDGVCYDVHGHVVPPDVKAKAEERQRAESEAALMPKGRLVILFKKYGARTREILADLAIKFDETVLAEIEYEATQTEIESQNKKKLALLLDEFDEDAAKALLDELGVKYHHSAGETRLKEIMQDLVTA